uniref:Uncharacterized protein n=1 Tax=Oryza brachyantha TaxID=4533 RepID=J3LW23_ORYBR
MQPHVRCQVPPELKPRKRVAMHRRDVSFVKLETESRQGDFSGGCAGNQEFISPSRGGTHQLIYLEFFSRVHVHQVRVDSRLSGLVTSCRESLPPHNTREKQLIVFPTPLYGVACMDRTSQGTQKDNVDYVTIVLRNNRK